MNKAPALRLIQIKAEFPQQIVGSLAIPGYPGPNNWLLNGEVMIGDVDGTLILINFRPRCS